MPERRRSPSRRTEKLWQKRLPGGTSGDVEAYTTSVHEDLRFGVDDVIASLAHARTLRGAGIISARQLRELERGLKTVRDELRRGNFILARGDEDIHSAVERRLYELCGEVAGTLHSGRSRNDQVATDLRLWARRAAADLVGGISELQEALLARAHEHRTTVLPGYTHGQRAQVVSLAHQLLAYVEMLQRDSARLVDARGRASASPLGSGALAGSTLPLDRQASRAELGLATVSANSMDAVSDRDFLVELSFACALLMTHISRMCEDMILWCSAEYGFAELDDSDATGSSLMPQKKNPDVLELARGRTGRVIGDLVALLTVLKGIPLAYDRDLQETKPPAFDAVDTAAQTVSVLAGVVARMRFNPVRMREAADDSALRATDLAERMVTLGVPFREAHGMIARVVREAARRGLVLDELPAAGWAAVPARHRAEVLRVLESNALDARVTDGGPGPRSVAQQLRRARSLIARTRRAILEA